MSTSKIPVLTNAVSGPGLKKKRFFEKEFKKKFFSEIQSSIKNNVKTIVLDHPQYREKIVSFEINLLKYAKDLLKQSDFSPKN